MGVRPEIPQVSLEKGPVPGRAIRPLMRPYSGPTMEVQGHIARPGMGLRSSRSPFESRNLPSIISALQIVHTPGPPKYAK